MSSHRSLVFAVALASLLQASGGTAAAQAAQSARDERCAHMRHELEAALSRWAGLPVDEEVRRWQAKAVQLCSTGRQAQGVRAYSMALGIVGQARAEK
ncbi:hypothetical protein J2W42_006442 [Rhizobium tibeticum]|uniref:hypothetical protein n=1 Tax=Rhizobium tibeticum TaxID=501024 RepID=UPI0027861374|nr:hypothetical protein [Rhizobium tibeticum]MDP9813568.1 hypothetical protein [Rhizobium tibeticum]